MSYLNVNKRDNCLYEILSKFYNVKLWEVSFPSNMIILQPEIHNIEYWWLAVPNPKYQPTDLTMTSASPCGWRLWVSEWLLFNVNSTIFQLYHGEKLIFNEIMTRSALYYTNTLSWFFLILLVHWNNSSRIDMSPHWYTLFWFRANQTLLFLFNAACFSKKQHTPSL
jgi:hypothetical protein